jgi:hypothetical protein
MMEFDASLVDAFIDRILELSADAHVRRRMAVRDSPEFHKLTGAITAYGTILTLFTTLERIQALYIKAHEKGLSDCQRWVS